MTSYTWSVKSSGSWGNAADWGPNGLPTDTDAVTIAVPGITVSVGSGVVATAYTLNTNGSTLSIDGGSLRTIHMDVLDGAFVESSGTFTVGGMGAQLNGATSVTGGTINVQTGSLQLNDGGTLAGTFTGAGVLDLANGSTYINTGFSSSLNLIRVEANARLGLNANLTYTHNLTVAGGVLDLFGHTLLLSGGASVISGVAGNGSLNITGTATLGTSNYTTMLDDGLVVTISGTVVDTNTLSLGVNDSGAKLVVGKAGHFDINSNWNITDASSVGSISNAGVFAKTGGGKVSQIDTSFSSTGIISAGIGELQLNGLTNSVGGTVSGGGTLGIAGGQTVLATGLALKMTALHQESGILVLNAAQTYANQWDMTGGVLNLNTRAAVLTLSGRESFENGTITSYGGTLNLNGTTQTDNATFGGPTTININGSFDQTGNIIFGASSNPIANIAAKASWLIENDGTINGAFGLINNAGLFSDPNGSATSTVQAQLASTGTVTSNATLSLAGTNSLGGTLGGSGQIDLTGSTVLEAGLTISVATLDVASTVTLAGNLADTGVFTQANGGLLDTGGNTLTLSGAVSLDAGILTDGGVLSTAGQTTIGNYTVTGGAELLIAGQADQTVALSLANNAGSGALVIAAGATYTVQDDLDITGPTGQVTIDGKLQESGTGSADIEGAVSLVSPGTLVANDQTLTLLGGGTLAGTLSGTGRISLAGGTFALASGLSALSGGLQVTNNATAALGANQTYAGDFISSNATFALGADTLTLTGATLLGNADTISGTGTLAISGNTTLSGNVNVISNATLTLGGPTTQLGSLAVGDPKGGASTASLVVASGGSDTLVNGAAISGDGILSVAGNLFDNGDGTSQISTSIVDSGQIVANLGTLQVTGSVTGSGLFAIGASGSLDFSSGATIALATGVKFSGAGTLHVEDLKTFGANIVNFAVNDVIQLSGLNAASLTGTYGNTAHTEISVTDGTNSILLHFSTAQTLTSISFTTSANGLAELVHH